MFYYSSIKGNYPKVLAGGRFAAIEMLIQFGNWKYMIVFLIFSPLINISV